MPLKGHRYHTLSDASLLYIRQDAYLAAVACKFDSVAECKYLDQVNDAETVLAYRERNGIRVA